MLFPDRAPLRHISAARLLIRTAGYFYSAFEKNSRREGNKVGVFGVEFLPYAWNNETNLSTLRVAHLFRNRVYDD
jgi:hypothetical protein